MRFEPRNPNRIHRWDAATLLEALIVGSAVEFWTIAPLAYYQLGHAGPNGGLIGVLSFLFNLPGLLFFAWSTFLLGIHTSWAGTNGSGISTPNTGRGVHIIRAITIDAQSVQV